MLTLTGSSFVLLTVTVEPPVLKVLSEEHEVAWMQKYFLTTWNQNYEDLLDVITFLVINPNPNLNQPKFASHPPPDIYRIISTYN